MARYELFAPLLKDLERGYVVDSGGPTNWGITQKTLASWRGRAVTIAEVKALTWPEASVIYRARYWNALLADRITSQAIAQLVVDWMINGWPGVAYLQSLVGAVADGTMGPATVAAINGQNPALLHGRLWLARKTYYATLIVKNPAKYKGYKNGWNNRLNAFFYDHAADAGLGLGGLLIGGLLAWGVAKTRVFTTK